MSDWTLKKKLVAGVASLTALAAGGGAIAATQLGSGRDSEARAEAPSEPSGGPADAAAPIPELVLDIGQADPAPDGASGPGFGHRGPGFGHGRFGGLDAAASYLGLSEQALHDQLEGGKTLAELARDKGKTVQGLKQAMTDAAKEDLDADVKAGRLTQAQEQQLLEGLSARLDDLVNGTLMGPGFGHRGPGFGHLGGLDAAASYLGLSEQALHDQLQGGKTLAELARDKGKTVQGLKQAMTDAAREDLDADVKAGRLTQAQEQQLLEGLSARLDDLVNGTLMGPGFGHRGPDLRPGDGVGVSARAFSVI